MALTTNFQIDGLSSGRRDKITKALQARFAERTGKWRVQFIAATPDDLWEVRVSGPVVETSGYIDGNEAQRDPERVADLVFAIAS